MSTAHILRSLRPAATTMPRVTPRITTVLSSAFRRSFHPTPVSALPYKDTQDRKSLKTDRDEETGSGRTGDVVGNDDASFNPSRTDPESEKKAARKKNGNPLDVSGATPEVSRPQGDEKEVGKKTGAGRETTKSKSASRAGSTPKGGKA